MNPYNKFKKIRNAPNGDPRFFIDRLGLANMVGATVADVEAVAEKVGFKAYRGRKLGVGYVVTSFNLYQQIADLYDTLGKE